MKFGPENYRRIKIQVFSFEIFTVDTFSPVAWNLKWIHLLIHILDIQKFPKNFFWKLIRLNFIFVLIWQVNLIYSNCEVFAVNVFVFQTLIFLGYILLIYQKNVLIFPKTDCSWWWANHSRTCETHLPKLV